MPDDVDRSLDVHVHDGVELVGRNLPQRSASVDPSCVVEHEIGDEPFTSKPGYPAADALLGRTDERGKDSDFENQVVEVDLFWKIPDAPASVRITSYNVCYTKLLRLLVHCVEQALCSNLEEVVLVLGHGFEEIKETIPDALNARILTLHVQVFYELAEFVPVHVRARREA